MICLLPGSPVVPASLLTLLVLFLALDPAPVLAAPALESNLSVSNEGYFVLSWEQPVSDSSLRLQQAGDPGFTTDVEEWPVSGASQFTQSGLFNGDYYFRLIDNDGSSNTLVIQVRHHSLARASLFFSLGAVLFSILVLTLLLGRRSLQRGVDG
ncbi:MAG: hypothetical protein R3F41_06015 [Gammaproteobacteria bacterium]|nr:hypothetical protein [Pseudomonadales bacterium]MCP5348470.1 hypothetical protein [Pseudomonadales bacterium]